MARSPASDTGAHQHRDYTDLSLRMLECAALGEPRIEFLTKISGILLEGTQCDALEVRLRDPDLYYRWEFALRPARVSRFTILNRSGVRLNDPIEKLCSRVIHGRLDSSSRNVTAAGSFWTGADAGIVEPYLSLALIRFPVDRRKVGLLRMMSLRRDRFSKSVVERFEGIAQFLGVAMANRRAQWALRERVKELTCLYGIGRIARLTDVSLAYALRQIVELLPPAWQFPKIAEARIVLDGQSFATADFPEPDQSGKPARLPRQTANLAIKGIPRGFVEVVYTRERAEFAEGPFLAEERSLIDSIAREVGVIVERREAEEYQSELRTQLRHADRLATLGQLAAGVAHELNEPLGSVLGFAQLIQKESALPRRAAGDLERIIKASLHAREVIQKLLVFSRQRAPVKAEVNLNRIVEEALYFLESRCAQAGIEVCSNLASALPPIPADGPQLHQVLVNLVVNGIQAMPDGGTLRIGTRADSAAVWLTIEDTGCGMSDEIKEKIFTPFFTTKDVNQGTGLGLAVVHGIVTGHGGEIRVESAVGRGARFEIRFPRSAKAGGEGG